MKKIFVKTLCVILFIMSAISVMAINYPVYTPTGRGRVATGSNVYMTSVSKKKEAQLTDVVNKVGFSAISTTPTIGADGTASAPNRGHRMTMGCEHVDEVGDGFCDNCGEPLNSGTGNDNVVDKNQMGYEQPLGSPLIPLVLFAMGYMAFIAYSRLAKKKE